MSCKQSKRRKVAENGIVGKLFLCLYGLKKKKRKERK